MKKQILKLTLFLVFTLLGIVAFADHVTIYLHIGTTDNNIGGAFKPTITISNATVCPSDTGDGVHYVQYNGKKYYYASDKVNYSDRPRFVYNVYDPTQENICMIIPGYKTGGITCSINNPDHEQNYWAQYTTPPSVFGEIYDNINAIKNLVIDDKVIQSAPIVFDPTLGKIKNIYVDVTRGKFLNDVGLWSNYDANIQITTKAPAYKKPTPAQSNTPRKFNI
jgi:hypothetical protein